MGLSRLVWFVFGQKIHLLEEKFGVEKILKFDMFIFPIMFLLVSLPIHYYIIGFMFVIFVGYFWSRNQMINNHFLNNFAIDPKYKATILSVKNQIQVIFVILTTFLIGFVMKDSYQKGHVVMGVSLFLILFAILVYIQASAEKL